MNEIKNQANLKIKKNILSKNWRIIKSHRGIYTGGKIDFNFNEINNKNVSNVLFTCLLHDDVAIIDYETGELKTTLQSKIEQDIREIIVTFAIRPNKNQIVTASRNLLIRLWDIETLTCLRTIKAHDTPVLSMCFDSTGTLFATGGSDRSVRVFDIEKGFCTHNFMGHTGIVTFLSFKAIDNDNNNLQLFSCSDDTTVRIWNLKSSKQIGLLQDHLNPVTCIDYSQDNKTFITGGRDQVINIWNAKTFKLMKTIPLYESIEGIVTLPYNMISENNGDKKDNSFITAFATGGSNGILRVWKCFYLDDTKKSIKCQEIISQIKTDNESIQYTKLFLNHKTNEMIGVTTEQNFIFYKIKNNQITVSRQIIGYNDEITCIKYIPNRENINMKYNEIAIATNSEQIRIMNRNTLSCYFLTGHTDIVMSLSVSSDGRWLLSASKDKNAKLWDLLYKKCICTFSGHIEALSACAISSRILNYQNGLGYCVTGSSDKTLKLWNLKSLKERYNNENNNNNNNDVSSESLPLTTIKAHDKDINTIAISPNDMYIGSGSQDKTVKIWSKDLKLIGICKGHKRGIWAIEFSTIDKCIASSSSDKTIKIWSIIDFTCLKTFEGHQSSVLNIQFVNVGMQLLSTSSDGIIKLWTIQTNECENTFDQHEDKIWGLSVAPIYEYNENKLITDNNNNNNNIPPTKNYEMITGGSDSTIHIWKDVTEEETFIEIEKYENKIKKEQELINHLNNKKLFKAILIAFELEHPRRLFTIFQEIIEGPNNHNNNKDILDNDYEFILNNNNNNNVSPIDPIILKLNDYQLTILIKWIKELNMNGKKSILCHHILNSILRNIKPDRIKNLKNINLIKEIESIIAYSNRHFNRIDKLLQKSYLIDYCIVSMKKYLPLNETNDLSLNERNDVSKKRLLEINNNNDMNEKKISKINNTSNM